MTQTTRAASAATALPLLLLLSLAVACGDSHGPGGGGPGGSGVDVSGDAPEDAADEVVDSVCSWMSACGEVEIECGGSSAGDTTCTGTLADVSYAECYDELHPELLADFRCVDLTPAQEALVNDCINGLVSQECMTEEELDAYVAAIERGEDPPDPYDIPPECESLDDVFGPCD